MIPQDLGNARNVGCLLRNTVSTKWTILRRQAICTAEDKAIGAGLPKPIGARCRHHKPRMLDVELQGLAGIFYAGFSLALLQSFLAVSPCFSLLEWEYLLCTIVYWKYIS